MMLAELFIILFVFVPVVQATERYMNVTRCDTDKNVVEGDPAWLRFHLSRPPTLPQHYVYVKRRRLESDRDFEDVLTRLWNDTKQDFDIKEEATSDGGTYEYGGLYDNVLYVFIRKATLLQSGLYEVHDSGTYDASSRLTCQLTVMESGPSTTDTVETSTASDGGKTTEQPSADSSELVNMSKNLDTAMNIIAVQRPALLAFLAFLALLALIALIALIAHLASNRACIWYEL